MNDRKYPEKLLANEIAEQQVIDLKEKINEKKAELGKLSVEIASMESTLEDICPHLHTKKIHGEIKGDYYNKGTYYTIVKCVLCNKELNRTESPSSYG